ncbi:MAG: class I SAM-dependent methyltransferase [Nitriliruptoraceae bacterium]
MTAPEPGHAPTTAAYAGAVDHYTSPSRRDWVKRAWEEPELVRLLDAAVRATGPASPLDVLDIGCGTGVALDLLRHTPTLAGEHGPELRYLGVDLDDDLLAVARTRVGDGRTRFAHADVRDELPGAPHDLYLSTGVPYSHLTREELTAVVAEMLSGARRHPRPTVLMLDVLGRYSLEWTSRWAETRWDYRMSFFVTDQELSATPMTTYGGSELADLVHTAATRAGCELDRVTLTDRSIVVGRHTATGGYTPGLRPYRQLVNDLADVEVLVDLELLRLSDLDLTGGPEEVDAFLAAFTTRWDAALERAAAAATGRGDDEVAAQVQPALAEELRRLERDAQPGLGVAHSLTATVVTRPGG